MYHKWKHPVHEEIYERICACRKSHGKSWRDGFFNNFRLLMPCQGEFGWRFNKEHLDESYLGPKSQKSERYSRLLKSQTTREFKGTIEEAIKISGASGEQLTNAIWQKKGTRYSFRIFFPIYFRLRKMGYSETELQG